MGAVTAAVQEMMFGQALNEAIRAEMRRDDSVKPLDEDAILRAADESRALVTLEEHSIVGGLGSAVAELLAESSEVRTRFKRIGVPPRFSPRVGSQEFLLVENGLDVSSIESTVTGLSAHT